jgi:hypothetical protein
MTSNDHPEPDGGLSERLQTPWGRVLESVLKSGSGVGRLERGNCQRGEGLYWNPMCLRSARRRCRPTASSLLVVNSEWRSRTGCEHLTLHARQIESPAVCRPAADRRPSTPAQAGCLGRAAVKGRTLEHELDERHPDDPSALCLPPTTTNQFAACIQSWRV